MKQKFAYYAVILIVALIITEIGYVLVFKLTTFKVENYSFASLEQLKNAMDFHLHSVDSLITSMATNAEFKLFSYKSSPLTENDRYEMLQIIDSIKQYKNTNPFIKMLYVYFKKTDTILTNAVVCEPTYLYQEVTPYKDIPYIAWYQQLLSYHYQEWMPVYALDKGLGSVITVMQSLPLYTSYTSEITGNIVALIDYDTFKPFLESIDLLKEGVVYILDNNNHVIAWRGNNNILESNFYSTTPFGRNYTYEDIAGQRCMISYVTSDYNKWRYVIVIPVRALSLHYRNMSAWFWTLLSINLVLSSILVRFIAYVNGKKDLPQSLPHDNKDRYDPANTVITVDTTSKVKDNDAFLMEDLLNIDYKKCHNIKLQKDILAYINNNYFDVNLSLTSIAHAFDITPPYLSSFFKQNTGENITDYINKLRINKAKELLQDKKLLLNDIAMKVGYINDAALIRVFKRYEGITPGRWRKNMDNE